MEQIPVHKLQIKELQHSGFDCIEVNGKGKRNYEGVIPHRHNYFELLLFEKGDGIHEIDFIEHGINTHSAHFVSPSQVHKLMARNAKGYVLCFTEDFMYLRKKENVLSSFPFYDFHSFIPHITLDKAAFNELYTLTGSIHKEFNKGPGASMEIIFSFLNIILIKIGQYHGTTSAVRIQNLSKHPQIVAFKILLEKHYAEQWSVQEYADKLHISPNHLNALCKKETGHTAIQLIHQRLLLEARRLLYSTDLNIKQIAAELNYTDVTYFNRFFKKQIGLTPLDYRKGLL
ncbi:MAG TPA: AraC family transcriptional regulator [Bacteroidia bacterium]